MKKILSFAVVALLSTSAFAQSKWSVDPVHSNVRFTVPHLVISEVEGSFKKFNGSFTASKADFTDAAINFTIDVNSIDTDNEARDKHLKADDFFNAEQFPTASFKSTSFKKVSGNKYKLAGNLTIRNVTKPITFDVVYGGTAKDGYGNTKAGFKATTVINRFDYGLKWNALTEAGGATVGQDITLDLKLQFAQAKS
jgi:polyisoprenoid-binding protein YceI